MLARSGDRFTYEDIRRAVADRVLESETLEYKADPGGRLEVVVARAVSALANSAGGNLVLGVGESDAGEPVDTDPPGMPSIVNGLPVAELVDRLMRVKIVPSPPAAIDVVEHPSGPDRVYVVITVSPRGSGPHRITQTNDPALNGRYYVRRGRESVEADHYVLRSLFREAEEGTVRVREYLNRRGLGDETLPSFGTRAPFRLIPTYNWTGDGDSYSQAIGDGDVHRVAAFAIPEVLRGAILDTGSDMIRGLTQQNVGELRGFGFRQEPTRDGRWLVQRERRTNRLGSYLEVHRTGYVEASHAAAGVVLEGQRYTDAGASLLIARAAIAVARLVRESAGLTDSLVVGLAVYAADSAPLFAWDPLRGVVATTVHPHVLIEVVADDTALRDLNRLILRLDERLGNAYGLDRTQALTEGAGINRMWHPLDGEYL